jgi:hypothetical protein
MEYAQAAPEFVAMPCTQPPTRPDLDPLRNIRRIDKGHHTWRVVMRRQHQHLRQHFIDSVYGSKEAALAAALAWRDEKEAELSGVDYVIWQREWMRRHNKSGTVGVYRHINTKKRGERIVRQAQWMAYWQDATGKRHVRSFNVSKYGEEGAKQRAICARQEGMAELAKELGRQVAHGPVASSNNRHKVSAGDQAGPSSTDTVPA